MRIIYNARQTGCLDSLKYSQNTFNWYTILCVAKSNTFKFLNQINNSQDKYVFFKYYSYIIMYNN